MKTESRQVKFWYALIQKIKSLSTGKMTGVILYLSAEESIVWKMGTYFRLVFSDKSSIDITDTELYLDLYCTDFPDGGAIYTASSVEYIGSVI